MKVCKKCIQVRLGIIYWKDISNIGSFCKTPSVCQNAEKRALPQTGLLCVWLEMWKPRSWSKEPNPKMTIMACGWLQG